MIISFLGPDGSGKSTLIEKVNQNSLFSHYYYFHLKPLSVSNSGSNKKIVTDPHMNPPYSKWKSYVKLMFFVYQYNWGWLINILPLNKKSSLIIFDRYYDDLIVDNKRYRYGGSLRFAKLIRYFIPKPDLYFVLTANADIIYKRKQEVSKEELERQINGYRNLADNKRYINVNVNRTPSDIVSEINKIIELKL